MIALRDAMSSLASKIPATVTSELADTYRGRLENVISTHISQCADQHKRLDAFLDMIKQLAAPFGIVPNMYISLRLADRPGATEASSSTEKGKFYTQTLGMPTTLKWGASPTEVRDWFHKGDLWFHAACPLRDNVPLLIHYIRIQLDSTWEREIGKIDWGDRHSSRFRE